MLYALRVALPDRPGMLASITGLIADRRIDVRAIDVLGGRAHEAVDHLLLDGEPAQIEGLAAALGGIPGVVVLGLRRSMTTKDSSPELDLVSAIARDPQRALNILTESCPRILAADWGLGYATDEPVARVRTAWAPDVPWSGRQPLRSSRVMRYGSFEIPDDLSAEMAVAAVTGVGVVLVGRNDGPAFHDAEVHRLDRLMKTIESVLAGIASAAGSGLPSLAAR